MLFRSAATAVRACELALAAVGEELPERAVREGLATVRWSGRFEVISRHPLTILDGLHTPLAAKRFREAVRELTLPHPRILVAGLLAGKDAEAIAAELFAPRAEVADQVIVAPPTSPRALDAEATRQAFVAVGASVQRAASVAEALESARAQAGDRGTVLVAGSIYTVAEAREELLGIVGDRSFGLR